MAALLNSSSPRSTTLLWTTCPASETSRKNNHAGSELPRHPANHSCTVNIATHDDGPISPSRFGWEPRLAFVFDFVPFALALAAGPIVRGMILDGQKVPLIQSTVPQYKADL